MAGERPILVVEDDPDIREIERDVLESEGFEVYTAKDGQDALNVLHRAIHQPCLILLDMMMPTMNGLEFLHRLHAEGADGLKHDVVVVSAQRNARNAARGAGIQEVLPKPFELATLLELVHAHCDAPSQTSLPN